MKIVIVLSALLAVALAVPIENGEVVKKDELVPNPESIIEENTKEVVEEVPKNVVEKVPEKDVEEGNNEEAEKVPEKVVEEGNNEETEKVPEKDVEEGNNEEAEKVPEKDVEEGNNEEAEKVPEKDVEEGNNEEAEKVPEKDVDEGNNEDIDEIVPAHDNNTDNEAAKNPPTKPTTVKPGPQYKSVCKCTFYKSGSFFFNFGQMPIYANKVLPRKTGYTSNNFECNSEGVEKCEEACVEQTSLMTNDLDLRSEIAPGKSFAQGICDVINVLSFRAKLAVTGEMECTAKYPFAYDQSYWKLGGFSNKHTSKNSFSCILGRAVVF